MFHYFRAVKWVDEDFESDCLVLIISVVSTFGTRPHKKFWVIVMPWYRADVSMLVKNLRQLAGIVVVV